jgi:Na+-transporting methylmalonyl-CoA/oxaloacetate decarboxylase beta subunit
MFVTNRAVLSGNKTVAWYTTRLLSSKKKSGSDPTSDLLMHAMARNASGVIGFAICAGILGSFLAA